MKGVNISTKLMATFLLYLSILIKKYIVMIPNINKLSLILLIALNFGVVKVVRATELKHNEFTTTDYMKLLRGRQLNYEFFQFIRNLTIASFAEEQNKQCLHDLVRVAENIENGTIWALRMIDSWGNIPAGLLYGNLINMGNYDECIRISKEISIDYLIKGKYCKVKVPVGALLSLGDQVQFRTAICVPSGCSANILDTVFKMFFDQLFNIELNANISVVSEQNCSVQESIQLSGVARATIIITSTLTGLAILCTIGDYLYTYNSDRQLPAIVKAFSIRHNARQTFSVVDYSTNSAVIPSLNGIRCLSLIWVIFSHDFVTLLISPSLNLIDVNDWLQTPFSMLLTQGFFSVDSFFFLSALLVTIIGMRELEKNNGKLNLPLMYLHRILRLTPLIAFAILVAMSLKYVSDGPYWRALGYIEYERCEKSWWTTLLYIQNYYKPSHICIAQTWYLAVDMQLYILSPILLIAVYKWGKKAVVAAVIILMLLWSNLFITMMIHDEYTLFYKRVWLWPKSFNKIYFPSHVRASPWIVGMIFGYYLHLTKGQRVKLPIYGVLFGWTVCFLLIGTCIFSLLPKGQISAKPLTTLEEALFVSLTRIAWPIALCWIVFACINDYGGPIESFLGHPLWQPLAKLSYCMYVFHFWVIKVNMGRIRTNTYFSAYDVMLRFWHDFGFTIILSAYIYLVVEAPIAGIIQVLLPGKYKAKSSVAVAGNTQVNLKSNKC